MALAAGLAPPASLSLPLESKSLIRACGPPAVPAPGACEEDSDATVPATGRSCSCCHASWNGKSNLKLIMREEVATVGRWRLLDGHDPDWCIRDRAVTQSSAFPDSGAGPGTATRSRQAPVRFRVSIRVSWLSRLLRRPAAADSEPWSPVGRRLADF